jgi:hypothetical protein
MIITRDAAVKAISAGQATYDGITTEGADNGCWIITNNVTQHVDHAPISDDERLVGCLECGNLVEPEADKAGIGCHCPQCHSTL